MDTDLKKLRDVLLAFGPLTDSEGYTFTCTPPENPKRQYICWWLGVPGPSTCDEPTYESAEAALGEKPDGHPGCVVVSGKGVLYPPKPPVVPSDESLSVIHCSREDFDRAAESL